MITKPKVAALVGEFLGVATLTAVLLAISKSGVGFSYFIASGVGLAVVALSLLVGSVSYAQFNPAVTLGLWTTRSITSLRAIFTMAAQFLGGYAAWQLYDYLVNQPLSPIAPKTFEWRMFWAEAVGALLIGFAYTAAVYRRKWGGAFAATVGGGVFLGMLVASLGSNGLANPALALGVRSWSLAYVAGPIVGAVVGANLYAYLFAPNDQMPRLLNVSRKSSAKVTSSAKKSTKKAPAKRKR